MRNVWNTFKRSIACWELNIPFTPADILDVVLKSSLYLINIGERYQILELLNKQYRELNDIEDTQKLYKSYVNWLSKDEYVLFPLYREGFEYFKKSSRFEGYEAMESLSTNLYFYSEQEDKVFSNYIYD